MHQVLAWKVGNQATKRRYSLSGLTAVCEQFCWVIWSGVEVLLNPLNGQYTYSLHWAVVPDWMISATRCG